MQEKRSEVRLLCADMVDVSWKDGNRKRRTTGLLEDISTSGACLQLEGPVPEGTELRWCSDGREFKGSVRYCVYLEIGYFVGIQFAPNSKWSKRIYKPQHLLDLSRFAAAAKT
jgi:hypothetical protein